MSDVRLAQWRESLFKTISVGIAAPHGLVSPSKSPIISNGETTSFVLEKSSNESDIDGEVYFSLEPINPSSGSLSS